MSWSLTAFLGFALMVGGVYLAYREHAWLQSAQIAEGTVIELVPTRGSKGVSCAPKVEFTAQDGTKHQFKRGYNSNPPGFQVGEPVTVAYEDETYNARILTFGQRYGLAVILISIGLAVVIMAEAFLIGRNYVPRIYLEGKTPAAVKTW
jgi:hypothetical protein